MSNMAVELFKTHADELFKIAGPAVANFAEQEDEIMELIEKDMKRIEKLTTKIALLKGEETKISNLIYTCDSRINGAAAALENTKKKS